MAFLHTHSDGPRWVRLLAFWTLLAVGVVAATVVAPRPAAAQSAKKQVEKLIEEASNHYDTLQIQKAETKLGKAIDLGEQSGVSGEVVARAHVMLGVVRYGATRSKKKALAAFKQAVKQDRKAEIPPVYQTPTLTKLMKKAQASLPPPEPDNQTDNGQKDQSDGGASQATQVDEFTHEPIGSAQAGEPLTVEAFVPSDISVDVIYFNFQRYDDDQWRQVKMKATDATRFASELEGYRVYTSQISYYLQAVDSSGRVVAESGSESSPHAITVLGSAGFDHQAARRKATGSTGSQTGETGTDGKDKDKTDTGAGSEGDEKLTSVAYVDVGGGTGVGVLLGGAPTANPDREYKSGLAPAFGHVRIGGGGMFSNTSQLGFYFRWQFSPSQDFEAIRQENEGHSYTGFQNGECLGIGLPGDCLLGLKYRWFFSEGTGLRLFSSIGAGVGRARHWLRLKERASDSFCDNRTTYPGDPEFCYRRDTVRPGWAHFGIGGGFSYDFNQTFGILGEAYLEVFFPDTAINLDFNFGPQFRF